MRRPARDWRRSRCSRIAAAARATFGPRSARRELSCDLPGAREVVVVEHPHLPRLARADLAVDPRHQQRVDQSSRVAFARQLGQLAHRPGDDTHPHRPRQSHPNYPCSGSTRSPAANPPTTRMAEAP
ncbi:hypothetical protein [Nannocystis pusilla]|uniref:hypothetical protein n=1 Tax=Nannocystis pusilla TaxID=889268 RepID=UPI003DA3BFAE